MIRNSSVDALGEKVVGSRPTIGLTRLRTEHQEEGGMGVLDV